MHKKSARFFQFLKISACEIRRIFFKQKTRSMFFSACIITRKSSKKDIFEYFFLLSPLQTFVFLIFMYHGIKYNAKNAFKKNPHTYVPNGIT